jgi:2-iminobutanoate/2-iminopropanoate deaminase
MARTIIRTDGAPKAIGPYSQAVRTGNLLFCSGQIALDPATGQVVGAGDVAAQAQQVMANIEALLAAGGAGFGDVVKTTIFLRDMAHFAVVNEIYGARVGADPPARSTVAVAGLPKDVLVEIEVIAAVG